MCPECDQSVAISGCIGEWFKSHPQCNHCHSNLDLQISAKCPNQYCDFMGSYPNVIEHMNNCEYDLTEYGISECESIALSDATSVMTASIFGAESIVMSRAPSHKTPAKAAQDQEMSRCILGCGKLIPRTQMEDHVENYCMERMMSCTRARLGCTWMDEAKNYNKHFESCPYEKLAPLLTKLNDRVTDYQTKIKKLEANLSSYDTRCAEESEIRANLMKEVQELTTQLERKQRIPTSTSLTSEHSGPIITHSPANNVVEVMHLKPEIEMLEDSLKFMAAHKFNWNIHHRDIYMNKQQISDVFQYKGHLWQLRFVPATNAGLYLCIKSNVSKSHAVGVRCKLFALHTSHHIDKHIILNVTHRFEKKDRCGDKLINLTMNQLLDPSKGFLHADGCLHLGAYISDVEDYESDKCCIM
ncbi:hypothetical protein AKO1_005653 [Acrasis kona]|uniref:TRAF-type domain-containing protein n=1 Tax=Acrasis kona TaxID=1008807 RepID=A0AAW2YHI0_9EUKA